ncbi:hypothetical protein GA0074692_1196 [Micromonospora pallida]|uniref:Uncharacterized protein n=1 Tax=Micromonospora pallida TaxID=145854 RepID=A0A1C6RWD6_9ACTN|nr:hypothetical protein [Micromonospora pallida]SCL21528.1 hypothetical protein GA0074692_1196 [Micromonospora pallida]
MGFFRSRVGRWTPPQQPACSCPEHAEDLVELVLPTDDPGWPPARFADLVEGREVGVEPLPPRDRWLEPYDESDAGPERLGPFHWVLWVGDGARGCYSDDAPLSLDQALLDRSGVERVEWLDREEFLVGAPTLCAGGVLAVVARALADPRVRRPLPEAPPA